MSKLWSLIRPLYQTGVQLGLPSRNNVAMTDASNSGWGALCEGSPAFVSWFSLEQRLHVNCAEIMPVFWALKAFLQALKGYHVLVHSDNMTVVALINCQGGFRLWFLYKMVRHHLLCAQCNLGSFRAVHIPGRLNQGTDMLSLGSMSPG